MLACAGPPCVGVSKLNRFRKGVLDEASNLVMAVKVIFQYLSERLGHKFLGLMECTDMDPEHRVAYDSVFGKPPLLLCASHFAPVTRKRLWWTNNNPDWPEGTEVKTREDGVRVVKPPATKKIPLQVCRPPGC